MANKRITTATTSTIAARPRRLRVNVNAALTGTITVTDDVPATPELAAFTDTLAVITNPAVGDFYQFGQFRGVAKVVTSAICDITIVTE